MLSGLQKLEPALKTQGCTVGGPHHAPLRSPMWTLQKPHRSWQKMVGWPKSASVSPDRDCCATGGPRPNQVRTSAARHTAGWLCALVPGLVASARQPRQYTQSCSQAPLTFSLPATAGPRGRSWSAGNRAGPPRSMCHTDQHKARGAHSAPSRPEPDACRPPRV